MYTTISESTSTTYIESTMANRPPDPCEVLSTRSAASGPNFKFGERSKTVKNEKDAYGFRRMSAFKANFVEVVQPSGGGRVLRSDTLCPVTHTFVGYPKGIERVHEAMLHRMSTGTEQSPELLRQRAERNLAQSEVNVLLMAAFLPATLKNILGNIRKLDSLIDILHDEKAMRRRFKAGDGTKRSLYLQWLFVWNQLYRDLFGLLNHLNRQARPIGSLVTGRSSATSELSYQDIQRPYEWAQIGDSVCDSVVKVEQRCVAVARVTCDVSLDQNSLGLDNPLYLAWDLLRWTWVADQVVDVGGFIASITSLHGLDYLGTSLTTRSTNSAQVNVHGFSSGRVTVEPNFVPGVSFRKTVTREVFDSPFVGVAIRNPFKNNVMVTAAAAAALSLNMREKDIGPILRHAR